MSVEGLLELFTDVYEGRNKSYHKTEEESQRWKEGMMDRVLAHTESEQEDILVLFECIVKVAEEGERHRGTT